MRERMNEEITFRRLEVLLAYLQAGNLAHAAELLDTSTVSVHRALHSLEAGVRCQLFRHEGRNLIPTEAALALAETSRRILKTMSEGIQAAREIGGYSSENIRIGSLYSLTIATVPRVIIDLKLRKPELQAELVLGSNADLLSKLKSGEIDAALLALPGSEPDVESIPLFEDDIFFAAKAGSKFGGMHAVDLHACASEPFVSLTSGFATYNGFIDAFRIAKFTPDVVMKVGDIFSLMNLVGAGVGYTLLPGRVRDLFKDKVQLIPLRPEYLMKQTIGLSFMKIRERDPNLLALASVCRTANNRAHAFVQPAVPATRN